jgi:type II secretion system protein H
MTLRTGNKRSVDRLRPDHRLNRRARPALGGFTLIELVLVMAMLLIVLAVAFPSLREFFRGRNLDSEARRFLSLTRYGQSRAVSEGVPMLLWIDTKQGTYGLQAQSGFSDEDDKAVEYDLDKELEIEVSLPLATTTSSQKALISAVGANLPAIRFTPDGFINQASPERVVIRQGKEDEIWISQNANRLKYEIQASHPENARR